MFIEIIIGNFFILRNLSKTQKKYEIRRKNKKIEERFNKRIGERKKLSKNEKGVIGVRTTWNNSEATIQSSNN